MKERANIFFNDWEIIPSANYCHKVADGTHDTPKQVDTGKKLITSTHLKEGAINISDAYSISENDFVSINRRSKVDKWDVLFSMIGTVGEIVLVKEEPDFAIKNLGLFKNKNETDGWWLYYYLSSKIGQAIIETYSTGSSQRFVSLGDLRKLPILNPPNDYKKGVINILKSYDDLIENNIKRIVLLEQMAEQIYKEWFVRMRFPGHENAEFEKGVPKGWLVELADYINVVKGKSYTGEEINEVGEGKPFVNLKSFNRGGGYRYDGIKFYTGKYHQKQVVKEGDIVMAVTDMTQDRALVGRVARIPKTEFPEMVISLDAAKIELKKKLPPSFFYATLRFGFFGNTIKEFANGSNVLHLKPELAYKMKSIIPTDESLMLRIDKIIEPYFNQIDNCFLQNQILKKTRDLLLPRLISGTLRVKEIKDAQLSKAEV